MHHSWRKLASLAIAGTLVLGVAACGGDDDDDDVASGDDTTETTEASEDGDTTETTAADAEPTGICAELPPTEETAEGATKTTVIALDYEYAAAESLTLGGQQALTLINQGEEIHEIFVGRIDPSETRTIEELVSSEEQPDTVEMVGIAVACPGERKQVNIDLSAPGRYVAICNVPVGTTPESSLEEEPSGPPHAQEGMYYEFNIA